MSRWIELYATSPSGKTLFVCRMCGLVSPVPTRECKEPPVVDRSGWKPTLPCAVLEEMEEATQELDGTVPAVGTSLQIHLAGNDGTVSWRDKDGVHRSLKIHINRRAQKK